MRSRPRGDGYTFGGGGYAMRQTHIPTALALVHLQHHAGIAGRMVEGLVHEKKIRPQLFNGMEPPLTSSLIFTWAECPP